MDYRSVRLKKEFEISRIYTIHYFEYEKDYGFLGEAHDFWELVYVDKGEITVIADERQFILNQGEIAFHRPNEYHNLRANGVVAPNLITIAFECNSPSMKYFEGFAGIPSDKEKQLLSVILKEARDAFSSNLGDTFLSELKKKKGSAFGCEQLVALCLMQLLISLHRSRITAPKPVPTTLMKKMSQDIVSEVSGFFSENLGSKLTLSDAADFAGISQSSLKAAFRSQVGMGAMAYFSEMKINRAKSLIREGDYNITQIASILGYDSIHDFSRSFKRLTGMSPSEYGRSVKVEFTL